MNILFVASECLPFSSTGGLGEVMAALPKALKQRGIDVRVLLPLHRSMPQLYKHRLQTVCTASVQMGWRTQPFEVKHLSHRGVEYYFIDHPHYFNREQLYNEPDDGERYAFFAAAATAVLPQLPFVPDVVHCHDWHAGMVSYLIQEKARESSFYDRLRTVFTIHNLAYQGLLPKEAARDFFSLDDTHMTSDQLEFYGQMSCMKAGIVSADQLTTVSHSYKEEIMTPQYGNGLDGLLRERQHDFVGILHGIDEEVYTPATDLLIKHTYDQERLERKELNKKALQHKLFFRKSGNIPLLSFIGPLIEQKGMPLLLQVCEALLRREVQIVIHGSGQKEYEQQLHELERKHPEQLKVLFGYDTKWAHRIYAGSDFIVSPSAFEPCGLEAMIALRYGTIPIVTETGGFKDVVQPYNAFTQQGNGFSFQERDVATCRQTIERVISVFHNEPDTWVELVKRAMSFSRGWQAVAGDYQGLYVAVTQKGARRLSYV